MPDPSRSTTAPQKPQQNGLRRNMLLRSKRRPGHATIASQDHQCNASTISSCAAKAGRESNMLKDSHPRIEVAL